MVKPSMALTNSLRRGPVTTLFASFLRTSSGASWTSRSISAAVPSMASVAKIAAIADMDTARALGNACRLDRSQVTEAASRQLFPGFLEPRRTAEKALIAVVQEAYIQGVFHAIGRRAREGDGHDGHFQEPSIALMRRDRPTCWRVLESSHRRRLAIRVD